LLLVVVVSVVVVVAVEAAGVMVGAGRSGFFFRSRLYSDGHGLFLD